MALREILTLKDERLHKRCKPVDEVTDRIKMTLEDMVDTMNYANGVGLAAPQIGVLRNMFVAKPDPEVDKVYYMINPKLISTEGEVKGLEGCLSVPGMSGYVIRPQKIVMEAMNLDGKIVEYTFEDFDARVMLHEYDHLQGIVYIDRTDEVYDDNDIAENILKMDIE